MYLTLRQRLGGAFWSVPVTGMVTAILIGIAILATYSRHGFPERAGSLRKGSVAIPIAAAQDRSNSELERLESILAYNVENYTRRLGNLDSNLRLQALLVLLSILLILRSKDELEIFGTTVPLRVLHIAIPIALLYFWLQFGFILDALIENRILGIELIRKIYPNPGPEELSIFHDAGMLDGWFLAFVPGYSGIEYPLTTTTVIFLALSLGTLVSANHACVLAVSQLGVRRYLLLGNGWPRVTMYLVPLCPLSIIVLSHLLFAYGGQNLNWLQLFVAILTPLLVIVLSALSLFVDLSRAPETVVAAMPKTHIYNYSGAAQGTESRPDVLAITLIGDSLSTSFQVRSMLGMVAGLPSYWQRSWLTAAPLQNQGTRSVARELSRSVPILATNLACPGASVTTPRRDFLRRLLGIYNLRQQVDQCLRKYPHPDAVCIWIGHNDLDWVCRGESPTPQDLEDISQTFEDHFERELRRLVCALKPSESSPCVVLVFGLVNLQSFFVARRSVERRHGLDSRMYPYAEKSISYYPSMAPGYRDTMIQLSGRINRALRCVCERVQRLISSDVVRVSYHPELSEVDLRSEAYLSRLDGWHPSSSGRDTLAAAALPPIKSELITRRGLT